MPTRGNRFGKHGIYDSAVQELAEAEPELVQSMFENWLSKERGIEQMFTERRGPGKVSEFLPRDFNNYVRHEMEMRAAEQAAVDRWVDLNNTYMLMEPLRAHLTDKQRTPFWGYHFGENPESRWEVSETNDSHPNHPMRGPVLGELTQWVLWGPPFGVPWRTFVDWPCYEEMDWEGNQRVASENGRYGRFPALPRRSSYSGHVPWQTREYVKPWPFDDVWKIPMMDDIYFPKVEIEDPEVVARLLNQDVLAAVDSDDIPVGNGIIHQRLGLPPPQLLFSWYVQLLFTVLIPLLTSGTE